MKFTACPRNSAPGPWSKSRSRNAGVPPRPHATDSGILAQSAMNGVIAFANPELARYAVRTEEGDFTLFDLLSRTRLDVGERMTGDFHVVTVCCYRSEHHGYVSVYVAQDHCTRSLAAGWVAGEQASLS